MRPSLNVTITLSMPTAPAISAPLVVSSEFTLRQTAATQPLADVFRVGPVPKC